LYDGDLMLMVMLMMMIIMLMLTTISCTHLTIILSLSRVGEPSTSRPLVTKRCSSPSAALFSNVSGSKSSLQRVCQQSVSE
jgi:hypothetical protein